MKVVFMGTPDFAAGALKSIIAAGHEVTAVVTQPDKPKGRGKELQFPSVKVCALEHNIPVFQPVKIKTEEAVAKLKQYEADIFVVAAFGQILTKEILEMPQYGCVNIHASLLPKYRGAAPIQWSIIDGEKKTGVTIMQMDIGVDTGDILMQQEVPIEDMDTGESLFDKLCVVGASLIVEALPLIEAGKLKPVPQKNEDFTYAKMLTKAVGHIHWEESAQYLERLVRGLNSWPSAYTHLKGKTLKIWEAFVIDKQARGEPGTVAEVGKDYFAVNTGNQILGILSIQLEGKKRMSTKDFLMGYEIIPGQTLGEL